MTSTKRKKIIFRSYATPFIVHTIIIYIMSMAGSFYLKERIQKIAYENWENCFRLSAVIVTIAFMLIILTVIHKRSKRKYTIIIEKDGNLFWEDNKGKQTVKKIKISRSLLKTVFGMCDLRIYNSKMVKIKKIKCVNAKIENYIADFL